MRSQPLDSILLPQGILQSSLELLSLKLTVDYIIGHLSGKFRLHCVDYLSLVSQLGYPVVLL